MFVAGLYVDVVAVVLLVLAPVLTPAQVLGRLPSPGISLLPGLALVTLALALQVCRPSPRRWQQTRWQFWRHHLPIGTLARATLPALLSSVLMRANASLLLWLLVLLLISSPITIPAVNSNDLLLGSTGMASSLPGGIGVNEGATELLLDKLGRSAAVSLPIAVLRRLIMLWTMVAVAAAIGVLPLLPGYKPRQVS